MAFNGRVPRLVFVRRLFEEVGSLSLLEAPNPASMSVINENYPNANHANTATIGITAKPNSTKGEGSFPVRSLMQAPSGKPPRRGAAKPEGYWSIMSALGR